jgi:hypothetical protein
MILSKVNKLEGGCLEDSLVCAALIVSGCAASTFSSCGVEVWVAEQAIKKYVKQAKIKRFLFSFNMQKALRNLEYIIMHIKTYLSAIWQKINNKKSIEFMALGYELFT